jgi:lysophospholipase L1-like esterase
MTQLEADQFDSTAHQDARAEGATASKPDRTHLNDLGKQVFGKMVAKAASESVDTLKPYILPNASH